MEQILFLVLSALLSNSWKLSSLNNTNLLSHSLAGYLEALERLSSHISPGWKLSTNYFQHWGLTFKVHWLLKKFFTFQRSRTLQLLEANNNSQQSLLLYSMIAFFLPWLQERHLSLYLFKNGLSNRPGHSRIISHLSNSKLAMSVHRLVQLFATPCTLACQGFSPHGIP